MDAFLDYLDSLENNSEPNEKKNEAFQKKDQNKGVLRLELKTKQVNIPEDSDNALESNSEPNKEFFEKQEIICDKKEEKSDCREKRAQELLKKSETYFQDEWMEQYEKAIRSMKNNYIVDKMRRGKFRYTKDHKVEILPEVDLYGKTTAEILNGNYDY